QAEKTSKKSPNKASATISVDLIQNADYQPRKYFDKAALEKLDNSIKKYGIIEPLVVRPLENGSYELVVGERRLRAAILTGLQAVPVSIKELTDEEAHEFALIENIQREDLNPLEETEGMLALLRARLNMKNEDIKTILNRSNRGNASCIEGDANYQTIVDTLAIVGLTPNTFRAHRLPLLKMKPDILEVLKAGRIEYSKALLLNKIKDDSERKKLLKKSVEEGWTKAVINNGVKDLLAKDKKGGKDASKELVEGFQSVQNRIKKQSKIIDQDKAKQTRLKSLLEQIEKILEE
ncbi:ParB/RepB/Spo0J family partition protein, partial [Okeania sp. SIO2G5]|uniref:ParB/RepB/Spo0J family partition protein n=1 Tax=Okeania sp. SIO2G5 TaxID=2607796 RepID=UPI0013BFB2B9